MPFYPPPPPPPSATPYPNGDGVAAPPASDDSPQLTYGTVAQLPDPPNLASMGPNEPQYLGYGCAVTYDWGEGLLPVPVAGSALAELVQFVRTDTGYCFKTITAVATCIGTKPTMPSWRTGSATNNDILVRKFIGSFSPGKMPDGTPIYGVIVQYVFVTQQAPGDLDSLDMGATPFDLFGEAANVLRPYDFVDYLVGPAQPVTPPP